MDFNSLKIFVAVVELKGFHAAAAALYKTQPAITNAIKKLEHQLGINVFDRNHYRPILTPEGEKLYQRAKSLVKHWHHLNEFSQQLKTKVESDIVLAIDVFYPLTKLETLLQQWIKKYPLTRFHLLSESLGGACERLLENNADIIISENLLSAHAVEVIILHSEKMVAVASPQFIKQYAEQLDNLETLSSCMQVVLRDSSKSNFSFGVIEHAHHWTVSDVGRKKEIIVAGLGWGRLPLGLIAEELNNGELVALKANHFDTRLLNLAAIRLQKPAYGPIANAIWQDLQINNKKEG